MLNCVHRIEYSKYLSAMHFSLGFSSTRLFSKTKIVDIDVKNRPFRCMSSTFIFYCCPATHFSPSNVGLAQYSANTFYKFNYYLKIAIWK